MCYMGHAFLRTRPNHSHVNDTAYAQPQPHLHPTYNRELKHNRFSATQVNETLTALTQPSVFTLIETICLAIWVKPQFKNVLPPLQVDVRRSRTNLLKLRNAERVQPAIFPEFQNCT